MRLLIAVWVVLITTPLVVAEDRIPAPVLMTNVNPLMQSAGFWISRESQPDQVLLDQKSIDAFNTHVRDELHLTKDIFAIIEQLGTATLVDALTAQMNNFIDKGYYTAQGVRDDKDFLDKVKQNMHTNAVVMGMVPRYGLIVRRTNQRLLPTDQPLYEKLGDVDFDQIQNSGLEIGEPVAIVHTSRDGRWAYVLAASSDGWVKLDDIVIADKAVVMAFAHESSFGVVTASFADLYIDSARRKWLGSVRMGTKLPIIMMNDAVAIIKVPSKDMQGKLHIINGYIKSDDIHVGYLPMTVRNIDEQAFRWLNTPYGWGDTYGYPDCSRFVASIYATMGLIFPRDSKDQSQIGRLVEEFADDTNKEAKKLSISQAPVGSLLTMKGHIVLYLGAVNDQPYIMHATSGYRVKKGDIDQMQSLMRVVISDLSLGEGSHKGSLLKRINRIVALDN